MAASCCKRDSVSGLRRTSMSASLYHPCITPAVRTMTG
jgi:hypothetical protein